MHKLLRLTFFLISFASLTFQTMVLAGEHSGCITCHQFPGLARMSQDSVVKILHIDEDKFRASVHGSIECRTCHIGMDIVPHSKVEKVDCQTQCHEDDKDKMLITAGKRREIHAQQQSIITTLPDQTSCKVCHEIYPHRKKPFLRSLLNMHTSYVVCETCHLEKSRYTNISYDWVTTPKVKYSGEPFGSYYDPRNHTASDSSVSLARIAPFMVKNGKSHFLMNIWDTKQAQEFQAISSTLSKTEKESSLKEFHSNVIKLDSSTVCEECHAENGILDFNALGFDQQQQTELVNMNIKGILTKYDKFYLPGIFAK